MLNRRDTMMSLGATALLAACQSGPPAPSTVTVNLSGQAGMNPATDGTDRAVTVLLLRLKGTGSFNSADYFALQADPSAALGADLLGSDRVTVAPGGTATKVLTFEPEATTLGVVALVREPTGRTFRAAQGISAGSTVTVNATLGSDGVSLRRA